jgi:hypothetical protein
MKCKMDVKVKKFWVFPAWLVLMAVFVGCGGGSSTGGAIPPAPQPLTTETLTPVGLPVGATIGATGGTLTSSDGGITITVPAGAVDADTEFTITAMGKPAGNAVAVYKLEPEGMTFDPPVTLTFDPPQDEVSRISIEGLGIAYHNAAGQWEWLGEAVCDTGNRTLSVDIAHFSIFGMFSGFNLLPSSAGVQVGETVQLQIMYCMAPDSGDELASLVFECRAAEVTAMFSKWSVNGTESGNSTVGTITTGNTPNATFTAPQDQPDPETVQVTVEVSEILVSLTTTTTEKVVLYSLITIGETPGYSGDFTVSAYGPSVWTDWTAHGTATWTPSEDYGEYGEYDVTVSITPDQTQFFLGDAVCILNGTTQTYENLGQIKDWSDPPTAYWIINVQWSATCTDDQGTHTFPNFLSLLWASGCAAEWASLNDAVYPGHLQGSYTWPSAACTMVVTGMPTATVTWNFSSQD